MEKNYKHLFTRILFLKRVKLTEKRRKAKPVRLGKYAFCVQTSRNGFLTCRYFLSATHQLLAFLGKKETSLNFLFFLSSLIA